MGDLGDVGVDLPTPGGDVSAATSTGDRVAVVTDSAASLPADAASRLGIAVVPMSLVLNGEVYADGTLAPEELVRRAGGREVSTSAPSPGDFLKVMEGLEGRHVLVTTVSQTMSASYEAAVAAAGYLPEGTAAVLDSRTAAGGQGLVVLAAAEAAAVGATLAGVTGTARRVVGAVRLMAELESLDQLARSGRVPGIAAWAGRSLGVRPVFEFVHGRIRARRPALSRGAAIDRMVTACVEARPGTGRPARLRAAVLDARDPVGAALVRERLLARVPEADVFGAPFSSVMVAHTGPGLVGLAWWWEEET